MPYNKQDFGRNGYQGAGATRKLYQVNVKDIVWNNSRDTINVTPQKLEVEDGVQTSESQPESRVDDAASSAASKHPVTSCTLTTLLLLTLVWPCLVLVG